MNNNYNVLHDYAGLLNNNIGKNVVVYTSYGSEKIEFKGIIEGSNKDYLILSDPTKGDWYIILFIDINYIKFLEKINLK